MMKILFVLTSHDRLGQSGGKTGLWYEELAAPYYLLKQAGAEIVLASPNGGPSPVDPRSQADQFQTEYTRHFDQDPEALAALANTHRLDTVLDEQVDALFYPGGHGPIFDLPDNANSIALIEKTYAAGKPIALVCHGSSALRRPKGADGKPIVAGKRVTGFTNSEEAAIGATKDVPFLLEDELTRAGGRFEQVADWQPHSIRDGLLITGQNPASAVSAAKLLLEALAERA
jgi:putative intracellular protease/amidase